MLLTKIEIKGFKSFGDKVTLHFGEGVTGVVGPNGSGKSNVVDAIRWVLGEQSSKTLRSEKMENVIFNGTQKRKPLQMAEVLMTFQNNRNLLSTEFGEVTIGRRYYRAGEGEYLLNGVSCRLKDIHNLFMDTGISSDSYAIIELKMVDEILNDKEGSRRQLFEEAAGIAKFKARRKETLKKLEETDADIERVEDLLAEIQKNMRQLDRQAKQARQYLDLKEQYKKFSLTLAKKTVQSRQAQILENENFLLDQNSKRAELDAQIATSTAQTEAEKFDLLEKEKQISAYQKELNQTLDLIRKKENEINLKNEQFKSLTQQRDALLAQIQSNELKGTGLKENLSSIEAEKQTLYDSVELHQSQLSAIQQEFEQVNKQSATEKSAAAELQNRLKNKQTQYVQSRKKLDEAQLQVEVLSGNISAFEQEKQQTLSQLSQLNQQLEELSEQNEILNEQKDELLLCQDQVKRAQDAVQAVVAELHKQKSSLLGHYEAKNKEWAVATALSQNLDSYSQSVKYLKSQKQYSGWVFLSDVVEAQPEFKVAVEVFLADKMEYLLSDNKESTLKAVAELNEKQKGRANFVYYLEGLTQNTKEPQNGLIPIVSVLKIEEKYRQQVQSLFAHVYVVEADFDTSGFEGVFVEKSGKWIKTSNHISGGQVSGDKTKKIGRFFDLQALKNQVEQLKEQLESVEAQIEDKTHHLKSLQNESYLQNLVEVERKLSTLEKQQLTLKTKTEQLSLYLGNSTDKNKQIEDKINGLKQQISQEEPVISELKAQTQTLEDELELAKENSEKTALSLSHLAAKLSEKKIQFNKYSDRLAALEREYNYKNKDYQAILEFVSKSKEHLSDAEKSLELLSHSSQAENEGLPILYQNKTELESKIKSLEQSFFAQKNQIIETEKHISSLRSNRDSCQQKIVEIGEIVNQIKLELTSVRDRMSVEFEIELSDQVLAQTEESDLTEGDLRLQVGEIKAALEKFGPVNFMAIEAYNEIKDRNDFIESQKIDLLKAKQILVQTINEIETVAKENFLNTFYQIRTNFIEIFRSLFAQQDTCDLILANDNDPLNSDIDIIAKPKGKRPLTINQLSGGEKTLTATALLFAIYLIKPAPFCVFDEVDAPLDDTNIDKFNTLIRKFSDRSQFIIVTHNKRTMACTDIMYGITMVDQISTVVPVDVRIAEEV